jgi:hypothetical protein
MWFTLDRIDLAYVDAAPNHICADVVLEVGPDRAFAVLTGDRWLEWFPDLKEMRWHPPRAVGGTRYVRLGRSEAEETFLAWDPGRRFAFSVDRSTLPVMKAVIVDFRLTAVDAGRRARVEYCWHFALRTIFRPLQPLARKEIQRIVIGGLRGLKRFVES